MAAGSNRVQGLAETYSLLGAIPQAAREQVGVEMARIGYEILAAQKRDVAKDTGALAAGLSLVAQIEELRLRVGLIGVKARSQSALRRAAKAGRPPGESYGGLYYGRFVEYGRRAQVVNVVRGTTNSKALSAAQKRARGAAPRKPYKMRVRAMAPRPFVHVDRPEIRFEQRIANFWSEVLGKAGAA